MSGWQRSDREHKERAGRERATASDNGEDEVATRAGATRYGCRIESEGPQAGNIGRELEDGERGYACGGRAAALWREHGGKEERDDVAASTNMALESRHRRSSTDLASS